MSTQKEINLTRIAIWIIALSSFGFGFWHAGLGLSEAKAFGSKNGGFFFAGIVTALLILAFHFSLKRVPHVIGLFAIFTALNIIFNFNYFWPNYAGKNLITSEMSDLQLKMTKLNSKIQNDSKFATLESLRSKVTAAKEAYVVEISTKGFGPQAQAQAQVLEGLLPGTKLNRRVSAKTPYEISQAAQSASKEVDGYLEGYLKTNKFAELQKLVSDSSQDQNIVSKKLAEAEARLKSVDSEISDDDINIVVESTQKYNQLCSRAKEAVDKFRCNPDVKNKAEEKPLEAKITSLGSFGHTASSALDNIGTGTFWAILLVCFLIDFLGPYALYRLGRDKLPSDLPKTPAGMVSTMNGAK